MSTQLQTQTKAASQPSFIPAQTGLLQRKCACGQHTVAGGECEECHQKREGMLQRAAVSAAPVNAVPSIVHDVLNSPGQSLDTGTRAFMEPRFGHDFSQVRVDTDTKAAESARAVNALAYTVGRDVVFAEGGYEPGTSKGKRLLAHELTHVVQQRSGTAGINHNTSSSLDYENEADEIANTFVTHKAKIVNPGVITGTILAREAATEEARKISTEDVWPQKYTPCDSLPPQFLWKVNWITNGRNGFIVQEISSTVHVWSCDGRPISSPTHFTPRYWEVWNVDGLGRMTPSSEDTWVRWGFFNSRGNWSATGGVYWVTTLDPAAHFATGKVPEAGKTSLSTTTPPKHLGAPLQNRRAAGKWECCGNKKTHIPLEERNP